MTEKEERALYWIWRGNTTKTIPEHIEVMLAFADEIRAESVKKVSDLDAKLPAMRRSPYQEGYGDALNDAEAAITGKEPTR